MALGAGAFASEAKYVTIQIAKVNHPLVSRTQETLGVKYNIYINEKDDLRIFSRQEDMSTVHLKTFGNVNIKMQRLY